jgi:membrane peptidoglycan carboxypeptidase
MKGYTPDTMLFDVPTEFAANRPDCPAAPDFESDTSSCFHPENFDHVFRGPVSLRTALAQSINVPAVKTLYLAGMPAVLETLSSLGVTTLTDPSRFGLSLVLGGGEVHLNELVGAYSALAADGIKRPEQMLLEVRDADNTILESYEEKGDQVIDPYYARLVNTVLSDVDARSGLFSGSLSLTTFPGRDIALKTGTTNNYRDAWTVGYTPSLVAGVWAGNNDNTPMKRQGSSILAALPIWNAFMKEALSSYPEESFPKPEVRPAAKPILGGTYSPDGEIHTILQYIDRTDPLGPPPSNPSDDPQYLNWEFGVRAWALEHGFHASSSLATPPSGAAPLVSFSNPPPGSFISSGPFGISGTILSGDSLTNISIRLNGSVLGSFSGPFTTPYPFVYSVTPNSLQLQNTLSVEALSSRGVLGSSSLILYTH